MGVETYHNYYFRVICKNEFGWSPWSKWNGPFTPQEGVVIRQFGDGWLRLGWVEPVLSNSRSVTKYEVQMCRPQGAMSSSVSVYQGSKEERRAKSGAVNYEFTTVRDDAVEAEAVVSGLLPGKKYQFRVRACIDNEWCSWENCLLSDVVTAPSAAPDVPHHVRVMLLPEYADEGTEKAPLYESADSVDSEDVKLDTKNSYDLLSPGKGFHSSSYELFSPGKGSHSKSVQSFRSKVGSTASDIENVENLFERNVNKFSISHNSIDIQWINGVPNGSAVQEVEVQAAKIREYHIDDIEKAAKAAGTEVTWDQALAESYNGSKNPDDLDWINITRRGVFLTTQSFRATGLVSGASYVFRVRQRNDVHWSSYSKASKVLTTLVAAPPTAPEVIMISSGHVIVEWKIPPDASFIFSTLRSDLRIAYFNTEGTEKIGSEIITENAANKFEWWEADKHSTSAPGSASYEQSDRVLVDTLRPMTTYVLKVRVLTVAGWTTWSEISKPFRTLGLP